jgi:Rod binding domain-containing protein
MSEKAPDRIRLVAEEFESVFIAQMFNAMFQGIPTEGLTKGGPSERIFRNMMITEVAKQTAHTQSIGIADAVEAQLREIGGEKAHYSQVMKAYEASQLASNFLSQQNHVATVTIGGK